MCVQCAIKGNRTVADRVRVEVDGVWRSFGESHERSTHIVGELMDTLLSSEDSDMVWRRGLLAAGEGRREGVRYIEIDKERVSHPLNQSLSLAVSYPLSQSLN